MENEKNDTKKEIKTEESFSSTDNESSETMNENNCSDSKYKDSKSLQMDCCCINQGEIKCCCDIEKEQDSGDCCCIKNGSLTCCCEHEKSLVNNKSYNKSKNSCEKSNIENDSVSRLIETPIASKNTNQMKNIKGNKTFNHFEESLSNEHNSLINKTTILGAACSLTQDNTKETANVKSELIEEIKEAKKNIKSAGKYDVFIVNDEGKINSYEINHYLNDEDQSPRDVQINQQLYGSSVQNKTISDKQNKYQKKLISILNEIKQKSQNEPIVKESAPTILEISQFTVVNKNSQENIGNTSHNENSLLLDDKLLKCCCGNGLDNDACKCSGTNKLKEEHESNIYNSSQSVEDEMFVSNSPISDHTHQSDQEFSDLEDEDEVRSLYNDELEDASKSQEKSKQQVYIEFERPTGSSQKFSDNKDGVYVSITELDDYVIQENLNTYGLSAEYDRLMKNESERDEKNNEEIQGGNISYVSKSTQSLAEALNVDVEEINGKNNSEANSSADVIQELIEHNDKIIADEQLNTIVSPIQESKSAFLSKNFLEKSNLSNKEDDKQPIISMIKPESTLNGNIKNENESSKSEDSQIKDQKAINEASLLIPQPENIAPIINDSEIQKSKNSETSIESPEICAQHSDFFNKQPEEVNGTKSNSNFPNPSINSKENSIVNLYDSKSEHESDISTNLKDTDKSSSKMADNNTSKPNSTNYVEIEIHLSNQTSDIKKTADISNSMITFIENDRDNYSQTLQNIRKNKVGKLVKFYEELEKKSSKDKY